MEAPRFQQAQQYLGQLPQTPAQFTRGIEIPRAITSIRQTGRGSENNQSLEGRVKYICPFSGNRGRGRVNIAQLLRHGRENN